MKNAIDTINANPKFIAWLGTLSGWASVDFLRGAQVGAALLAGMVSMCALILTAPKAWREVVSWFRHDHRDL